MSGSKKIKSKTVTLFYLAINPANLNELEEKSEKESHVEYDEEGNELVVESYIPGMGLDTKVVNTYSNEGSLVERKEFLQGDEFGEKSTFEYEAGKVTKELKHYIDNSYDTIEYKYNEDGHLIEKVLTDNDGEEESKTVYQYVNGHQVSRETYEDGELESKETRRHDEQGNVIEAALYSGEELETKVESEYNAQGNIVRSKFEDGTETRYEYDENGNVIKEVTTDEEGEEIKVSTSKYDEEGRLIERNDLLKNVAGVAEQRYKREYSYTYF